MMSGVLEKAVLETVYEIVTWLSLYLRIFSEPHHGKVIILCKKFKDALFELKYIYRCNYQCNFLKEYK